MKKIAVYFLCVAALSAQSIKCSLGHSNESEPFPTMMYVPVPLAQELQTEQPMLPQAQPTQRPKINWFPHIMKIVGNVGKIFLDRHNKAHVKEQIANIIDSILAFAHEVGQRPISRSARNDLIEEILKEIEETANDLPRPIMQ